MKFRRKKAALLATLSGCLLIFFWRSVIEMTSDKINRVSSREHQKKSISANRTVSGSGLRRNYTIDPARFEPEVTEDLQTINSENPRIPHIMHFVFITGINGKQGIPSIYRNNVISFLNFNPSWTYYFWSDVSARQLIAARQPALLSTYDKYSRVILKADALRYVLMYEFGGVYADLDIYCMRPLDRATMKYACILTPEPFEHSAILYRIPYFFSNALMLCRPKHPFFKHVIETLPKTASMKATLDAAGTRFFTNQFISYNKIQEKEISRMKSWGESNSPNFYQGSLAEDHNDATYVANTQYFMSSYDRGASSTFQRQCNKYSSYNSVVRRGCDLWKKRKSNNTRSPFSYTDHNWKHMYSIMKTTQMVPIQSVIPQIKQYNSSSDIPD